MDGTESTGRPTPARIWALLGPRTGDNNTVLALAEAAAAETGGVVAEIRLRHNVLRLLPPALLGAGLASLDRDSRKRLVPPWPDLVIGVGRRSVPAARWVRERSAGRARIVQTGRPRCDPALLDLVVTTPQYGVPPGPNVLELPVTPTRQTPARLAEAAADWGEDFARFPAPRRALLLGGSSWPWRPDEEAVEGACRALVVRAEEEGGSVLAIASRRTPAALAGRVRGLLAAARVPAALLEGKGERNPYPGLLALADSIAVTADSVSMVSDALASGRPVSLVPVRANRVGEALLRGMRALRLADADEAASPVVGALGRAWGSLVRRGLVGWPRDLWFFWRGLEHQRLTEGRSAPPDATAAALARIRPLLRGDGAGEACPGCDPPAPGHPGGCASPGSHAPPPPG
ncbi:ELM1/GtrOC1 family putative glycosyltransferase [Pararoseomonas indoligenes]|uniref:Mitochondrial fission ELM1 family protein n=1 Tax=Roseomonas indoligenes TaxID=2820811 RepID=A0A940MUL9_9PROT|nr:ELM1/GtrOC1 family putative glycosyltransferase [Pararoseomonas indoligenes]MBP0491235.1 mitochondrial fission ELM1 family protein [Pararoseomonas indoligenes]